MFSYIYGLLSYSSLGFLFRVINASCIWMFISFSALGNSWLYCLNFFTWPDLFPLPCEFLVQSLEPVLEFLEVFIIFINFLHVSMSECKLSQPCPPPLEFTLCLDLVCSWCSQLCFLIDRLLYFWNFCLILFRLLISLTLSSSFSSMLLIV